eukprot:c25833_g1_i1.p1 GENE.c25833_g1_i1~~c25833_g1_i1.p1  ORF type:complete len:478 (+),score=92.43 c25833_g1_i1:70-1434(+)
MIHSPEGIYEAWSEFKFVRWYTKQSVCRIPFAVSAAPSAEITGKREGWHIVCNGPDKVYLFDHSAVLPPLDNTETESGVMDEPTPPQETQSHGISGLIHHDSQPRLTPGLNKAVPVSELNNPRHTPTAHACVTRDDTTLLCVGYSSGAVWIVDALSQQNIAHFNANGGIDATPVVGAHWRSIEEVVVVHESGVLYSYRPRNGVIGADFGAGSKGQGWAHTPRASQTSSAVEFGRSDLEVHRDIPLEGANANPTSRWRIGKAGVIGVSMSPDGRYLTTVGQDGLLRVIDYDDGSLVVAFRSYYGGLRCVAWSHDGQFIVAGGEDDLVTVWEWESRRVVARCEGHHSWTTQVTFDPTLCFENNYRIISVGLDMRLIFWDLNFDALIPPKEQQMAPPADVRIIDAPKRSQVAYLHPTTTVVAHSDPVAGVAVTPGLIVTITSDEAIFWKRPENSTDL